ncbi:MAG: hypothetical protein M1818_005924 [Claussenomyces sp. TS43310]|nr:MAG: hypothetical protein M1818_005924 [Claussenomyces sp. TS43310]
MTLTELVLDRGYQMLYVDQRGTGLSTTVSAATLALQGDVKKQIDYLKLFRADNIVRDCEAIRQALTWDYPLELKKWSVFGQSFGGFCAFTYLSKYPQGLREVFTTGGIPPVGKTAKEVYTKTYDTLSQRNASYYQKFPEDVERVHDLVSYINSKGSIPLPSGGILTVQRFLSIGLHFGMHGGIERVHNIVLRMHSDILQFGFVTRPTLTAIGGLHSFDTAIIYAVLHESIYCQGTASAWAAESVGRGRKEYQWLSDPLSIQRDLPVFFSGEMIYRFMFDTFDELMPLRQVADMLAQYKDWPALYDEAQLARNEVPVYASSYIDDMYVNINLVQETVRKTRGVKQLITNTMYHDAVRSRTEDLLKSLFALRDDVMD